MDIKLTRSKSFRIWLYLLIGINIVTAFMAFSLARRSDTQNSGVSLLIMDFKDTHTFKANIGARFDFLAKYITYDWEDSSEGSATQEEGADVVHEAQDVEDGLILETTQEDLFREEVGWRMMDLNDEGQNLIYYAKNPKTSIVLTNSDTDLGISEKGYPTLPEGYDYFIYYNGSKFVAQKGNKPLDVYDSNNQYKNTVFGNYMRAFNNDHISHSSIPDIRGCQILLVVKKDIVSIPYSHSTLFFQRKSFDKLKYQFVAFIGALIATIGLFVFTALKPEYKESLDRIIGNILGKTLIELKVFASFILWVILGEIWSRYYWLALFRYTLLTLVCFWWLYLLWIDIRANGRNILTKNIGREMKERYRRLEGKRSFQKAQLFRLYSLVGIESILIFFTFIFALIGVANSDLSFILIAIALVLIGVSLFFLYVRRYVHNLDDISKIINHTELIKQGDVKTKLQLSPDPDLYMLENNLNTIQEGIAKAVESSIKSERMKVELITNISHDLKTPLTSIISYVDLLSKEQDLPEHVKDFIRILAQKAERLKILIQDLFDLSKVVSGEMEFEMKPLDLGKLIEQTLADLDDKINESQLVFRVNLPSSAVPIISDGNKLYRVFLNLFQNALKYSFKGTRVYVDLVKEDGKAVVTIKNTANYEMNFSAEEITERFVRGDKARSGEGSGLGLAIAQNFTRSCGGDFEVKVDGDLFKVILSFDIESDKNIDRDDM